MVIVVVVAAARIVRCEMTVHDRRACAVGRVRLVRMYERRGCRAEVHGQTDGQDGCEPNHVPVIVADLPVPVNKTLWRDSQ